MGAIIAIGGGEIGGDSYEVETLEIDQRIVALSGKINPKVLFVPTASHDADGYVTKFEEHFGGRLGCIVDCLKVVENPPDYDEMRKLILDSDIVYVGGGNTKFMIQRWKELEVDVLMRDAYKSGVVLSGLSAGANIWYESSCSDALIMEGVSNDLIEVEGIGLLPGMFCPHYDEEKNRPAGFKKLLKATKKIGWAVDNCAALEVVDEVGKLIVSRNGAGGRKLWWNGDNFIEEELLIESKFMID